MESNPDLTTLDICQTDQKCCPARVPHMPLSVNDCEPSVHSSVRLCRQVDPAQFSSVCERSSSGASCRLASAFVHLCQQNYIPLQVPVQCCKFNLCTVRMCTIRDPRSVILCRHDVYISQSANPPPLLFQWKYEGRTSFWKAKKSGIWPCRLLTTLIPLAVLH